jgi:hypothetical protein
MIQVKVDKAESLPQSKDDAIDPFCVVRIGARDWKTPVLKNEGSNPVWNWSMCTADEGEEQIEFSVMEQDDFSRPSTIGVVTLKRFEFERFGFEGCLPMGPPQASGASATSGKGFGSLHVQVLLTTEDTPAGAEIHEVATELEQQAAPSSPSNSLQRRTGTSRLVMQQVASSGAIAPESIEQLLPGDFRVAGEGTSILRAIDDCEFLAIPRVSMRVAAKTVADENRQERVGHLRKWLPGASKLPDKAIEFLAGAFKEAVFPRGHVFCTVGCVGELRRLFILKEGSCSQVIPLAQREAPTNPEEAPPTPMSRAGKALGQTGQVGLLAKGAVAGYTSALFGLAEPYTVVANEQTTMLMISTEERPLTMWPREVVHKFHEMLKARTEWHSQRAELVAGARNGAFGVDKGRQAWSTADSVFLRHKILDPQQTRVITRSVEVDDAWTRVAPPERGGLSRNMFGTRSAPQAAPPPVWPNETPTSLAGCATPWGNWLPSGTLALASTRRASTPVTMLPKLSRGSSKKLSTQPNERPHVDLMRPGDWRGLTVVASGSSAEKMYWRQVRMMSATH